MLGVVVGELAHASGRSLYKVRVYWGVCSKGHHESLDAVGGRGGGLPNLGEFEEASRAKRVHEGNAACRPRQEDQAVGER